MHGNNLIVIENGQLVSYALDDKLVWDVGRPSKDNMPDIRLHSATVSRRHGRFQNIDGMWFYYDKNGKNGTVYNGARMKQGIRGRVRPVALKDKDVLIFGGGEEAVINSRTIWALFSEKTFGGPWRVEDTKGLTKLTFSDGEQRTMFEKPGKGTVIEMSGGMAIYMGDITYLTGTASVCGAP
jgi:pSer/pThr/pTyr-binding forkhead associated (FHA) protein